MPLIEQVFADYRTSGMSLKAHPVGFFREQLDKLRVTPGGRAGKNSRRPPSARRGAGALAAAAREPPGESRLRRSKTKPAWPTWSFAPNIWERYYAVARRSPAWIAHGCLENKEGVIHLVVNRLEDLSALLGDVRVHSRNFIDDGR